MDLLESLKYPLLLILQYQVFEDKYILVVVYVVVDHPFSRFRVNLVHQVTGRDFPYQNSPFGLSGSCFRGVVGSNFPMEGVTDRVEASEGAGVNLLREDFVFSGWISAVVRVLRVVRRVD